MTAERDVLATLLNASSLVNGIFDRWHRLELPDCWLVAGAVAQTVWNVASGRPTDADIRDVDIVYFDGDDVSAESERRRERRTRSLFADSGFEFDVKNQARVHQWYAAKFGSEIAPYLSVEQAIATLPTTATAVGVRPGRGGLEICAPFGLGDLLGLIVRPNKRQITRAVYDAKIARWRRCWPNLTMIEWDDANPPD